LWGLGLAAGLALPVIGPVIAGGTAAAIAASAATGAAAAGIVGLLIGFGIPEENAKFYERELKAGRIIVTVKTGTREAEARETILRHGGYDATCEAKQSTQSAQTAATGRTPDRRHRPHRLGRESQGHRLRPHPYERRGHRPRRGARGRGQRPQAAGEER
jgi:hypothetical protein